MQTLGEEGKAYRVATELEYHRMRDTRNDTVAGESPEVRRK